MYRTVVQMFYEKAKNDPLLTCQRGKNENALYTALKALIDRKIFTEFALWHNGLRIQMQQFRSLRR